MADLLPSGSPLTKMSPRVAEMDENAEGIITTPLTPLTQKCSTSFKDINDSKAELLARVQSLRKDLREWRGKLDNQVHNYRQELGELRNTLNVEVEQLKSEFQDLRLTLRKQLEVTAKLSADMLPSKRTSLTPAEGIPNDLENAQQAAFLSPPTKAASASASASAAAPNKITTNQDVS